MTRRWPPRVLLLGGLGVAACLAALIIDYRVTLADLPPVGERFEVREDFAGRARLYVIALCAVLAATIACAPRTRELWTDVGVAGVVLGLVTAFLLSRELRLFGDQNTAVLWLPSVGLMVAAALGTLATRREPQAQKPVGAVIAGRVALALTAATWLFVLVGHADRTCSHTPPLSDVLLWLAVLCGLAASVAGLIALTRRRWIVALVSLPSVLVGILSAVVAACLE